MEELITTILPNMNEWFSDYVGDMLSYLGAGILLSFILWTIAYAIDVAMGWIGSVGR